MSRRRGDRIRRTPPGRSAADHWGRRRSGGRPAGRTCLPARRQASRQAGQRSGRSDYGSRSPRPQRSCLPMSPPPASIPAAGAAPPGPVRFPVPRSLLTNCASRSAGEAGCAQSAGADREAV